MDKDLPACLDYGMLHENIDAEVAATWEHAPADHAWLLMDVTLRDDGERREATRRPIIWRPTSSEHALDDMTERARHIDWNTLPWPDIHQIIGDHQDRWQERKSAKQRREKRAPIQARFYYKISADTEDPEEAECTTRTRTTSTSPTSCAQALSSPKRRRSIPSRRC